MVYYTLGGRYFLRPTASPTSGVWYSILKGAIIINYRQPLLAYRPLQLVVAKLRHSHLYPPWTTNLTILACSVCTQLFAINTPHETITQLVFLTNLLVQTHRPVKHTEHFV